MREKNGSGDPSKLYLATLEVEVYMMAPSREEAERRAMEYIQEEIRFGGGNLLPHVQPIEHKPRSLLWPRNAFVYGGSSDQQLGDIVDQLPEEPGRPMGTPQ